MQTPFIYSDEWQAQLMRNAKLMLPGIKSIKINADRETFYKNTYSPDYENMKSEMQNPDNYPPQHTPVTFSEAGFVDEVHVYTTPCFSYSLYFVLNDFDYYNSMLVYLRYLTSVGISARIIRKMMPTWLVRIYFDEWLKDLVYGDDQAWFGNNTTHGYTLSAGMLKKIAEVKTAIIELAKNIINLSNVESYFISTTDSHELIRCMRILPLLDDSISICVMRDADSVFTAVDAHNYNLFSGNDNTKLFMYTNLHNRDLPFASDWHKESYQHNIHKIYNFNDSPRTEEYDSPHRGASLYFEKHDDRNFSGSGRTQRKQNSYPYDIKESILCGLFASKIHISSEILEQVFNKIRLNILKDDKNLYDEIALNMIYSPLLARYHKLQTGKSFYATPEIAINIDPHMGMVSTKELFTDINNIAPTNFNSINLARILNKHLCLGKELARKIFKKNFNYIWSVNIPTNILKPIAMKKLVREFVDCETETLLNLRGYWVRDTFDNYLVSEWK
jgi:hypothetical protein